ncbi:aldehyde dehydrogenase family protein, partial [Streptomyces albidoflavus]|uniref:aldehyde dehydrogenase family protein n=1 Tax=Streptomyces albidoflavus TaxID=1886 RepID=UPI0033C88AD6
MSDPAPAHGPAELPVLNPATGELLTTVPAATPADVDAAVRRATAAQRALRYQGERPEGATHRV